MVKICFFADVHYAQKPDAMGRHYAQAGKRLRQVLEEPADLYVNLGDLIDGGAASELWYREMRGLLDDYPCWHLAGNHDGFALSQETLADCGYAAHDLGGLRWIALDTNYDWQEKPYDGHPGDWTKAWLPQEQLLALEGELASCADAVILCHQNLDDRQGDPHVIGNAAEVRRVLEASGKVRMVVQGHYHPGLEQVIGGIPYHTLPALCEGDTVRYATALVENERVIQFVVEEKDEIMAFLDA